MARGFRPFLPVVLRDWRGFLLPRSLGRAWCASDGPLSPAAILGHLFTGVGMVIEIPYAYVLMAGGVAVCCGVGALVGVGVTLLRMRGERRA